MSYDTERYDLAKKTYEQYMGREYKLTSSPYDPPNITEITMLGVGRCYGESFSKTRLDMKTKSLITITAIVSQANPVELKTHMRAAHHQGVTKEELVEWLVHINSYMGAPTHVYALRIAREVWKEMAEQERASK
jgi:4-carboxymuconolactone decarboxylase